MKIVIIGGGFAGVWSALAAARHAILLGKSEKLQIIVINKNDFHGMRPRFYEDNLNQTRIPLAQILTPLGIQVIVASVNHVVFNQKKIELDTGESISYDRLILAAGSQFQAPNILGLEEYSFNVDTFEAAQKLAVHLEKLPSKLSLGRSTIAVVGGSFTGLEVATELAERLKNIFQGKENFRIIIIDRNQVGGSLGSHAEPYILAALEELGVESVSNSGVTSMNETQLTLTSGEVIDTQTVICATGMRANPLTKLFPIEQDMQGRLPVDRNLRISGLEDGFAAGDVCAARTDETHLSLMSCQHAMPQGRVAGHNAVADLYDQPLLVYQQPKYVTCLDLGSWGALYCEGWDRQVISVRDTAKKIKNYINHERIYPPLNGNPDDLMKAADPTFKPLPDSQ
ncbi:MAG TPA: FAD-dependent oxidoreductase [Gammaproteobacteria bacterium]|nr:FAD-dependent oxidoreductase [Gammaproteobacteria bacterium]